VTIRRCTIDPTVASPSTEAGPGPTPGPRPFRRRADGKLLAGVCGGLADHLGLDPLPVRIAFVVLSGLSGFGIVLYAAYWVVVPQERPGEDVPPGLAAASRWGLRPRQPGRRRRVDDMGQLVALVAMGAGILLLLQQTSLAVSNRFLWPALVVAAGLALVWRQADETERERAVEQLPAAPWLAPFFAGDRFATAVRLVGGSILVLLGLTFFLAVSGGLTAASQGLLGAAVALLGVGLIVGPWALRSWRTLAEERRERIRSQTRADLAAHLHDSVLQTLALIQKQSADPREVVRLARRQERDLRGFLYGNGPAVDAAEPPTLASALSAVAAEVEDAHGVPIEVVTVGDRPVDERFQALLAAAREAMVNAARHSGAHAVDIYAEVDAAGASVFVRDRGKGFDLTAVPDDRLGVRGSIVGRMQRYGGTAEVRTGSGEGTEVRLKMDGVAS